MENSGYNFPSGYFTSMDVGNIVGPRYHGLFYTGLIVQGHEKRVTKGIVGICIPILWRKRTIWDEIL